MTLDELNRIAATANAANAEPEPDVSSEAITPADTSPPPAYPPPAPPETPPPSTTPPPPDPTAPLPWIPLAPPPPEPDAPAKPPPLLAPAVLGWDALNAMSIPPRESFVGDWFCANDYGVIFGRRGLGKSWFAMYLACALARGRDFGPWKCHNHRRVLYVDGEMALDAYRDRLRLLDGGCGNFFTLSHQAAFDKTQTVPCLSDLTHQTEVTRICEEKKIDILFLDNAACLFRNVKENDADDWRDFVEGWLLNLRRRKIAVVLVIHAGRNGEIRGTSKREDSASWILRMDEVAGGEGGAGARFTTRFTKHRNPNCEPPPYEWLFETAAGKTTITHKEADPLTIFVQWVRDGLTSCGDIAAEMGISKGQVSKLAARAINAGRITKRKGGRDYELV